MPRNLTLKDHSLIARNYSAVIYLVKIISRIQGKNWDLGEQTLIFVFTRVKGNLLTKESLHYFNNT